MNILIFFLKYSLLIIIFMYIIYNFFFYIIGYLNSLSMIIFRIELVITDFYKEWIELFKSIAQYLRIFFSQHDSIHQLQNIVYNDFYKDSKILIIIKLFYNQIKTFFINFYIFFKISTKKNYYFNQLFLKRKKQSSWFWKIRF